jgi:hypothetical protein
MDLALSSVLLLTEAPVLARRLDLRPHAEMTCESRERWDPKVVSAGAATERLEGVFGSDSAGIPPQVERRSVGTRNADPDAMDLSLDDVVDVVVAPQDVLGSRLQHVNGCHFATRRRRAFRNVEPGSSREGVRELVVDSCGQEAHHGVVVLERPRGGFRECLVCVGVPQVDARDDAFEYACAIHPRHGGCRDMKIGGTPESITLGSDADDLMTRRDRSRHKSCLPRRLE